MGVDVPRSVCSMNGCARDVEKSLRDDDKMDVSNQPTIYLERGRGSIAKHRGRRPKPGGDCAAPRASQQHENHEQETHRCVLKVEHGHNQGRC